MTQPAANALELLRNLLAAEHPSATMKIEAPLRDNGVWELDIDHGPHQICVEWSPARPKDFAVTRITADTLFQMGGDAVCATTAAARAQVRGLLAERLGQ